MRQRSAASNLKVTQIPACYNDYAGARNDFLMLSACLLDFSAKDLVAVVVYKT